MSHRVMARIGTLTATIALLAAAGSIGCAHTGPPRPPTPDEYLGQQHPLRDRIFDLNAGEMISRDELMRRLVQSRFVLLGEKHDNALHHRYQAEIVRALATAGRRPLVGWEMITTAHDDALASWLATKSDNGASLGPAIQWKDSGWPPWEIYQPIADAAAAVQLTMVAGGLPRKELMALYGKEDDYLGSDEARALGVHAPLPAESVAALSESIVESHCGYAPEGMVDSMVVVQQIKDGHMAKRLVEHSDADGAVLIAGGEHVRKDRAVPFFLRGHGGVTDSDIATLSFVEVDDDTLEPTAYQESATDYDYLWFTTRVTDDDPCEKYRHQLEKMKSHSGES